jgi:tetratricopeptide (TPR) repeat protein
MRPVWWGLLFAVVCMPMVFVLFLIPAAKYPSMDSLTLKLPMGIRRTVAELALQKVGYGNEAAGKIDRAIKLDPESAAAWSRRCGMNAFDPAPTADMATCQKAIGLDPSAENFNGLGLAQEQARDYCTAEDSFTRAIKESENNPGFLRNMARAALRCGHTGASSAGFEVAEGLDAKAAADPDDDGDTKNDLLRDREYLAVVYGRLNEQAKAQESCAKAHPGWKACHCELNDSGVACSGGPAESARNK